MKFIIATIAAIATATNQYDPLSYEASFFGDYSAPEPEPVYTHERRPHREHARAEPYERRPYPVVDPYTDKHVGNVPHGDFWGDVSDFDEWEEIWDQNEYEERIETEAEMMISLEAIREALVDLDYNIDHLEDCIEDNNRDIDRNDRGIKDNDWAIDANDEEIDD